MQYAISKHFLYQNSNYHTAPLIYDVMLIKETWFCKNNIRKYS